MRTGLDVAPDYWATYCNSFWPDAAKIVNWLPDTW